MYWASGGGVCVLKFCRKFRLHLGLAYYTTGRQAEKGFLWEGSGGSLACTVPSPVNHSFVSCEVRLHSTHLSC